MAFNFESMNKRSQSTMCKGVNSRELGDIRNLKEFVGCVVLCDGFFFTHSAKFNNDQVVIVGTVMAKNPSGEWERMGQYCMNTPGRTYDEFKEMANNDDALASILRGELAITNIEMANTKSGTTVVYKYRTGKARYDTIDDEGYMVADEEEELPFL